MIGELGSAEWKVNAGWPEQDVVNGSYIVFGPGPSDGYSIAFKPTRHFLSVAPTRSGKGVSLIIPNLLMYAGSSIVIDPKGENAWITAPQRRRMGQKVILLDPWGEVNRRYGELAGELEIVARFNPLSILDPSSPHYADDLAYLADALIINQGKDPHWDDSARELVAGLMAYCCETLKKGVSTLSLVRMLLSKPAADVAALAAEAVKLGPESVACRKLGRFAVYGKEVASIISTALTQTAFLDSAVLSENMTESDFSFDDLTTRKATIYLVLPVDKLQTYGRWLRLMVSIGIRTVARNTIPLENPVLFLLDEFGTIGRLSAVAQAYGLMAGLQMIIWAFTQDLVQLKRDYPDDWETFIGNSEAVSFFNIMDNFTAEYLSKLLGTTTIERICEKTAKERSFNPEYTRVTDQIFARQLLHASEVRNFNGNWGIVVARDNPVKFAKMVYYYDKFLYDRARHDPHFPIVVHYNQEPTPQEVPPQQPPTHDYIACINYLKEIGLIVNERSWLPGFYKVTYPNGDKRTFYYQDIHKEALRIYHMKNPKPEMA
jgi:type IV secretion system protein VirD4